MLEHPNQSNVSNIESAKLERLRSVIETELTKYVLNFNTEEIHFSTKVKIENEQLIVVLLKNKKWVFDAYIVDRPLLVKLDTGEDSVEEHIINNAVVVLRRYIDNPEEVRQFSEHKKVA